ncbi:hypothetical protein [Niastella sp. OAS944]|uniref:hypothetical protein n=1 Tax=Niastella sp. OAS944 TaxID=2664089 RepID=UPI00346EF9E7|nr:hypothetical protein [Chitinophagaceae bacterium OAS944]
MMVSVTRSDSHVKDDITFRAVVIPDDIKWLQQLTGLDAGCLISFYESIQASSFIQSMMAWDNDQPILQVDICEALFDDLGVSDIISDSDYTLRFQFAPHAPIAVIQQALYSCVEYVFYEMKAKRILMQVRKDNKLLLDWVKAAPFTNLAVVATKLPYAIYMLTK